MLGLSADCADGTQIRISNYGLTIYDLYADCADGTQIGRGWIRCVYRGFMECVYSELLCGY